MPNIRKQLQSCLNNLESINSFSINSFSINSFPILDFIKPWLSKESLTLIHTIAAKPNLKLYMNNNSNVIFPAADSGLKGYDLITPEVLEGFPLTIVYAHLRFLSKLVIVPKDDPAELYYWIRRFGATINLLAENKDLRYGSLCNPYVMKLVDTPNLDPNKMRLLINFYSYSHSFKGELNESLNNEAFVEEGEIIDNTSWDNLPDISKDTLLEELELLSDLQGSIPLS